MRSNEPIIETPMKLPDKPSELIRLALRDLEKVEQTPGYVVDMASWHVYQHNMDYGCTACCVCFAGAVIAMESGISLHKGLNPWMFEQSIADKLCTLDDFREGDLRTGLRGMGLEVPAGVPCRVQVVQYRHSPSAFKSCMKAIADLFEGAGI